MANGKFGHTDHFDERCKQRGIPNDVAILALMEGRQLNNISTRYLLTEDMIADIRLTNLYDEALLKKALKVCPIVVVGEGGTVITAFRPTERIDKGHRGRNKNPKEY